jgi:ATP-dependent protease Clp ATPase subunit
MKNVENFPVIGQEKLVSELDKIISIFEASEGTIKPHFILTGESGSGKTFTINSLAVKYKTNFIEVNAAQLTKEGTSGNSLSKALSPLSNSTNVLTIVFVDEFDKLFISGNSNDSSAHESTTGVQNEFLKLLEGRTTQVFGDYGKYITIPLDKVLFVFAGAFNNEKDITLDRLREIGIKTEFLGRVGLIYNTTPLTIDDLNKIVDNSDLLNKYCKLFNEDFEKVSLYIKGYLVKFYDKNTLGARMINTLIQQYFIKGGVLNIEDAKEVTFQKTLNL